MAKQPPIKLTPLGEYVFGALSIICAVIAIAGFCAVAVMLGVNP